jgi:hypothetical protein
MFLKPQRFFCAATINHAAGFSKGEFAPEGARTRKRNLVAAENEWTLPARWTDK